MNQREQMRTAFILGAGFSRAISKSMPLTDELGDLVREQVPEVAALSPYSFKGGYFEAWLSRLAEPQPDLPDHVNARNYGVFLRITEEIHTIIQTRELQVLESRPPWWLQRLVGLLHSGRSVVITFNYDTLVERTADILMLYDWQMEHRALPHHLTRDIPPTPPEKGAFGAAEAGTFRLLKLHGSLDSYWVPGDASGATINRWYLAGRWGTPLPVDEARRRQRLPGRSPFIVPPAAAKSAFYSNPISRELWRSAAEALASADRVALIGYSLPQTDLVTTGMLVDALSGHPKEIYIVNLSPEAVVQRLIWLGVPDTAIRSIDGLGAITSFVELLEAEVATAAIERLKNNDTSQLLMIGTSPAYSARVTGVEQRSDGTYVQIEAITNAGRASQVHHDTNQLTVSVSELLAQISVTEPMVKVQYTDGCVATIIDIAEWRTDSGLGNGHWAMLIPSAMPVAYP